MSNDTVNLAHLVAAVAIAIASASACCAGGPTEAAYDASLGTLPTAQGFVVTDTGDSPAPVVADGVLAQGPTASNCLAGYQFWTTLAGPEDFDSCTVLEAELSIIAANDVFAGECNDPAWKAGYYLTIADGAGHIFFVGITSGGVFLTNENVADPRLFPRVPVPTEGLHRYRLDIGGGMARLHHDGIEIAALEVGTYLNPGGEYAVNFGDASHLGSNQSALAWLTVTHGVSGVLGDLDCDGDVDGADLGLLLGAWGGEGPADLSGDGTIDGADLGILLGAWS